jgi:hypothetical protein
VRNVELERPARAWDQVRHLAKQFGAPRRRIVVRDERGDIAILVGASTAKRLFAGQAA